MPFLVFEICREIIYHLRLFPQDQTSGLEPDATTDQNCILISSSRRYYFNDNFCDATFAPLCEAPLEAHSYDASV